MSRTGRYRKDGTPVRYLTRRRVLAWCAENSRRPLPEVIERALEELDRAHGRQTAIDEPVNSAYGAGIHPED